MFCDPRELHTCAPNSSCLRETNTSSHTDLSPGRTSFSYHTPQQRASHQNAVYYLPSSPCCSSLATYLVESARQQIRTPLVQDVGEIIEQPIKPYGTYVSYILSKTTGETFASLAGEAKSSKFVGGSRSRRGIRESFYGRVDQLDQLRLTLKEPRP